MNPHSNKQNGWNARLNSQLPLGTTRQDQSIQFLQEICPHLARSPATSPLVSEAALALACRGCPRPARRRARLTLFGAGGAARGGREARPALDRGSGEASPASASLAPPQPSEGEPH
ncbi:hypothetical protein NL676_025997 [Syzygium grande]|nr:hypothetical protein NL676_025997 [Syzygium grande]